MARMLHWVLLILIAVNCSCNRAPEQANISGVTPESKEDFESMVGIAIGYPGKRDAQPGDLQEEEQPNACDGARELAYEGCYTPC